MNNFLKKVIAQSPDDLQIISAICAESKVKISDIKYLPSTKIFLLSVLRMDKETANGKSINSVVKFEFIESSKSTFVIDHRRDKRFLDYVGRQVSSSSVPYSGLLKRRWLLMLFTWPRSWVTRHMRYLMHARLTVPCYSGLSLMFASLGTTFRL